MSNQRLLTIELLRKRERYYAETANDPFTCKKCNCQLLGSDFYFQKDKSLARCKTCKECVKKKLRTFHKTNEQFKESAKRKRLANPKRRVTRKIQKAIKSGKLIKPTICSRCGAEGILDSHHPHGWDTPEKVFDIEWLCRACHIQEHRDNSANYPRKTRRYSVTA